MKDVRSQGREGVVQCGHFAKRGFFICGRPHFLVRNFEFFEIYGMSVWIRWGGSIFRDFVRTSFMDGSLSFILKLLILITLHAIHNDNVTLILIMS